MGENGEYSGPADEVINKVYENFEDGRYADEETLRLCELALSVDPNCFPAHVVLGYYEMDRQNHNQMFDHFLKALELSAKPHNVFTWDSVIMALDDGLKDYERLVIYLRKFFEKEPKLIVAQYLVRILGGKLDRKSEAVAVLDAYLLKYPDDKKAMKLRKKAEKGKWLWI